MCQGFPCGLAVHVRCIGTFIPWLYSGSHTTLTPFLVSPELGLSADSDAGCSFHVESDDSSAGDACPYVEDANDSCFCHLTYVVMSAPNL